jgi:hypothetical protein
VRVIVQFEFMLPMSVFMAVRQVGVGMGWVRVHGMWLIVVMPVRMGMGMLMIVGMSMNYPLFAVTVGMFMMVMVPMAVLMVVEVARCGLLANSQ